MKLFPTKKILNPFFLISYLCDTFSIVLFSIALYKTWVPIVSMMDKLKAKMDTVQTLDPTSYSQVLGLQQEFAELASSVIKHIVIFIALSILIYLVFQSISWFIAHRLNNNHPKKSFFGFFTLHSFIYFALIYAILYINTNIASASVQFFKYNPFNFVTLFIILVLTYILFTLYAMKHFSWRKFVELRTLLTGIISFLIVFLSNYLVRIAYQAEMIYLAVVLALVIVPLSLSFVKVFYVHSINCS